MKIVYVASEAVPFAKTGGLADVIGALPHEIRLLGHETSVFLPRYKSVNLEKWGFAPVIDRFEIPVGTEKESGRVFKATLASGVDAYVIDHPEFFMRDGLYGTALGDYPDNDRRFVFFQRAVLETLDQLNIKPDIIHCHDWQTGLIPVYLKTHYGDRPIFKKTKTVFTIHNLGYQGNFPPDSLPVTGFGWELFKLEKLEFYGKISFLKGGLVYADILTTVSERYAKEIQTKEFGCGLEGVLSKRKDMLLGIVNGIDYEEWNPETDKELSARYNFHKISHKEANKHELQKENGLKIDSKIPILGLVTRLVDQKGIDILIPALEEISSSGIQFVLLGTGEEKYHQVFRDIAKKNRGKFGIHILFDSTMAKRIYAGCDMMLFPSYYEPCGLGQMIALRFGTIPVARATGGLADTIQEFHPETGLGNGFLFAEYSSEAFIGAVRKAVSIFHNEKNWARLVKNAMESDFSWKASA
ncbi:MAG: glycogen synthase GlgA, partial [Candidatus Omnitrophica bacterium]|nr:glycogen synthase GlgA [Candidatus Omnitrophota bacterium]